MMLQSEDRSIVLYQVETMKLSDIRLYSLATAISFAGFGCSSAPKGFEYLNKGSSGENAANISINVKRYREPGEISPGFSLRLSSVSDGNVNGTFNVEHDGFVKLPYKVRIEAAGKTVETLQSEISSAYTRYFKGSPDIRISVAKKKYSIDIRGLVDQPGKQLVDKDTSLDELIGDAKGLQRAQDGSHLAKYVRISQLGRVTVIKLSDYYTGLEKIEANWQGGETIFFQNERGDLPAGQGGLDPKYLRILGEIRNPGEYLFNEKLDFFDYFTKAGGPTALANIEKISVIRTVDGKRVSYEFDASDTDEVPKIKGGDIVVLNAVVSTQTERTVSLVSTVMGTIVAIALVVIVL